tara:strand:+ start:38506 stop:38979 length:474 start_codon:yes stop_codon:yes gene_type:complete
VSVDAVARLAAIHTDDVEEAIAMRLPREEIGADGDAFKLIEDAILGLIEQIEEAIYFDLKEVTFSVETAEMIAIALKTRKRQRGKPRETKDEWARRTAIIGFARRRKLMLKEAGMPARQAAEKAALEAEELAISLGYKLSSETILDRMKRRDKKYRV